MKERLISFLILTVVCVLISCTQPNRENSELTVESSKKSEITSIEDVSISDSKDKTSEIKDISSEEITQKSTSDVSEEESKENASEEENSENIAVEDVSLQLYAKKAVNVREKPSTKCNKIGVISKGESIKVTGISENGWYRVEFEDKQAFISQSYLIAEVEYQAMLESEKNISEQASSKSSSDTETNEETDNPDTINDAGTEDEYEQKRKSVVSMINQQRSEIGVALLEEKAELNAAAQIRANELVAMFSHTRPNQSNCFSVLDDCSVTYITAGENIAAGQKTPEEVMESWMNSEGHRANILSESFGCVGIGICYADDGYGIYWVQLFTD